MTTPAGDREIVRRLAERVAEIAREPRMQLIRQRWDDVENLRRPDRAPVWCKPVGCWSEILPEESLQCEDPRMRGLERGLRQTIHKREIDDDEPVSDVYYVGTACTWKPANLWGVDMGWQQPDVEGGAWAYDPPLLTPEDFDRLQIPVFTYDQESTDENVERAEELFEGIFEVKSGVSPALGPNIHTQAAGLRGLEQIMMDMIDRPDLVHRLMSILRDGVIRSIDTCEKKARELYAGMEGDHEHICLGHPCGADSQEFDQVSPKMWEEFLLDYQKPIFTRFGRVTYGCCEDLTGKIDGVLSIPNLRGFNSSAWTDLSLVIEKVACNYFIVWRQKASDVVFPHDTVEIERHLENGARELQGCCYQIVLRELQTLAGHPDRLHEWTRLARNVAEKYA